MADLKRITLPSGSTYNIVDQGARDLIAELAGSTAWLGVTTTPLTDGATTNPIVIDGESVTAKTGSMVAYGQKEFVFNGTTWQEFGDLSVLGNFAYADTGWASITPKGSVSAPTISHTESTVNISPVSSVGTLPELSLTVQNETLSIAFNAGTLPTLGTAQSVVSGITSVTASAPTFTGTNEDLTVRPIRIPILDIDPDEGGGSSNP